MLCVNQTIFEYFLITDTESEDELSWQLESLSPIPYDGATVTEHFYIDGDSYVIVGKAKEGSSYEAVAVIYMYDEDLDKFVNTGECIWHAYWCKTSCILVCPHSSMICSFVHMRTIKSTYSIIQEGRVLPINGLII